MEIARAFDRPGPYISTDLLEGLQLLWDMAITETRKAADFLKQAATMLENFGLGSLYRLPSVLQP